MISLHLHCKRLSSHFDRLHSTYSHDFRVGKYPSIFILERDFPSEFLRLPSPEFMNALKQKLADTFSDAQNPSALVFLLFYCACFRCQSGVRFSVRSDLPIGAGLGSSASFCVALASAFVYLTSRLQQHSDSR